ncbi:MAG: GreA/GreB family elongation factor [Steroidobacteraceae bacterium]|jgi:transcription elongation GreA/GreB family factor|nr:GreA/GreB family elongation factor [Steroidobacteraceae bacterium]
METPASSAVTAQPAASRPSAATHAFVRGADGTGDSLPPPVRQPERGYMTAAGAERYRLRLQQLIEQRGALLDADHGDLHARADLVAVEREIAQVSGVLQGAIVIRHASPPRDEVRFGATVVVEDDGGERSEFQLVGELEAAPEQQRVNWFSPLGRALAGARPGERVEWSTPGGRSAYVVRQVRYD